MLVELFLTTLSMAASYQPANHCVPVPKSSVCNPWAGNGKLFIDGKKLAEIYGVKNESIDAASWEVLMASATQGGQKQAAFWNGLFYCPTYQGQLLQYSASYTCLTDIFVYSEACNREVKSATPFCPEICENFGVSLNKLISGKEYCPTDNLPADKAEQIKWRRQLASQTSKLCQATLKKPYFEQTEQCVGGVLADQKSCGFSGNYTITKMFCDSYPF